jgi:hypothetical protein
MSDENRGAEKETGRVKAEGESSYSVSELGILTL